MAYICPICDKALATPGGLEVHREFAHGLTDAPGSQANGLPVVDPTGGSHQICAAAPDPPAAAVSRSEGEPSAGTGGRSAKPASVLRGAAVTPNDERDERGGRRTRSRRLVTEPLVVGAAAAVLALGGVTAALAHGQQRPTKVASGSDVPTTAA